MSIHKYKLSVSGPKITQTYLQYANELTDTIFETVLRNFAKCIRKRAESIRLIILEIIPNMLFSILLYVK